jgi:hypothetical protein
MTLRSTLGTVPKLESAPPPFDGAQAMFSLPRDAAMKEGNFVGFVYFVVK